MEFKEAQTEIEVLRQKLRYYGEKYYTEDISEISDFEYDALYRRLEVLEGEFPELATEDSPTQKVGGGYLQYLRPGDA